MMDVKRIRETINQAVERYHLGEYDFDKAFSSTWLTAQLSFACTIGAITFEECDALRLVIYNVRMTDRRDSECVDFPRL